MSKSSFGEVWKRILACEGEEFKTATNLPFTYIVNGNSLCPSRTEYNISKSNFATVYDLVPISGPWQNHKARKRTSLRLGNSAILHDERISKREW